MYKEPKPMREIHEIQERLHRRWKNMSDKEVIADIHKGAEECIKKYNLKLKKDIPVS